MSNAEICRLANIGKIIKDLEKELDNFKTVIYCKDKIINEQKNVIKKLEERSYKLENKLNKERFKAKISVLGMISLVIFVLYYIGD